MRKKICIFTGTRAEYGILKPLIDEINADKDFQLQLLVSCMHLSPEFGLTYREIESDGVPITERVEMLLSSDSSSGLCKSMGLGLIGYVDSLERLKPDLAVVLGDRFEALAFAIACYVLRIPLAHIHGGEITEGVLDEGFRHCITKLSHYHFTSTEEYRKNVIQLGEDPNNVFNVGALGIDNIKRLKLLSKRELERRLKIKFKRNTFLITFHPITLDKDTSYEQITTLLEALDELEDTFLIFTKANADTGGRVINKVIDEYVIKNSDKSKSFTSLGHILYLSTLKSVDAIIGNSSSGIIEAPTFKIPTVNIGDRQKGRIKAKSVIDCELEKNSILEAIKLAVSDSFKQAIFDLENPYGDGNSAKRIVKILKEKEIVSIKKKFYKINF